MGKRRNKTNTTNTLRALRNIGVVAGEQMKNMRDMYKGQVGKLNNVNPYNMPPNFNYKEEKRKLDDGYRNSLRMYIDSIGTLIKPMDLKIEGKDSKEIINYCNYLMLMIQHLNPQDKAEFLRAEFEESTDINMDFAVRKVAQVTDKSIEGGEKTLGVKLELAQLIDDTITDDEIAAEAWNNANEQLEQFKNHAEDFIDQEMADLASNIDSISIIENMIVGTINNTVYNVAKSEGIQPDILADEQPIEE